jgi:predicted HTH domain antitoxin
MAITIELPREIEQEFEKAWDGQLPRKVIEAVAAEGYRQDILSHQQVAELLGLNRWQTDAFLKERAAYLHYSADDLKDDLDTLKHLIEP